MLSLTMAGTLLKAADRTSQEREGEQPEAWMLPLELNIALAGNQARADLARDIPQLFPELAKSYGGATVTSAQIAELKHLVRQHYLSRLAPDIKAAFWAVPDATKARWRRLGILGPAEHATSLAEQIDDAVIAARVAEILDSGASYREMKRLAAERPQTRIQELARGLALEHAGRQVAWLADRHGFQLGEVAAGQQLAELRQILADFLGGKIAGVATERQLATHLRATLGGGDFRRDWQRLAVSETRWAFNYATLIHYQEEGRERLYFVVQPNACAHCKQLLLNRDGSPKVFALDEILENVALTGGTNAGRSAALIGRPGGWLVTALIHPWCRCRPQPWLEGLPFVPVGDVRR